MSKFAFSSNGVQVKLESNFIDSLDSFVSKASSLIPSIRSAEMNLVPDIVLGVHFSKENNLHLQEGSFLIEGNYSPAQLIMDSVMLLSRYIENTYNQREFYSLHSSAVVKNNSGVLLIGPSNSGKTTLAYKLKEQNSCDIVSGDRTVIDSKNIYSGSEQLSFRKGSIINDFPESNIQGFVSDGNEWSELVKIAGDKIQSVVPYEAIFLVKRIDAPFQASEAKGGYKFLRFYEQISYFQEVFPNIVLGQMKPMPSFNSLEFQEKRISFSNKVLSRVPLISISGRLDELADFISKNYLKS